MLAPICLFTYNRPDETKKTVEALKNNHLSRDSDLIIFSDGPKNNSAVDKVEAVRKYLKTISGFKSVTIHLSESNKGLASSIISGVTQVINEHCKVIVLEDDLVTSPNFLDFMNQALTFYADNNKIFSLSGYTKELPSLLKYDQDYYLGYRASSWGWGTWANRWRQVDWGANGWQKTLMNPITHYKFMRGGSDMPYMLWKQMNNKIDSWAIRWCYHQFKQDLLTVFPSKSKLYSIGIGRSATHTKNTKRFDTKLDSSNKLEFIFDQNNEINVKLVKEFRQKYSIQNRLLEKI